MKITKLILPGLLIIAAAIFYFSIGPSSAKVQEKDVKTIVKGGEFVISVSATGELQAKRSEKIRGPQGMRTVQIYQTTITNMVPEGTVVKAGDYVATLDRTELDGKIKEALTEIEKIETQLEQAKIDTAIEMREIRDQLINLKFAREEKLLQVEQNKYEPSSVIQQTQIELQKTERDYNQLLQKLDLTKIKTQAKVAEILTSLKQNQHVVQRMNEVGKEFSVMAPKDGMVIYARSWEGKIGPGSRVSTWDPVVAELPDLSDMVSKTFVNEVDISRVKLGQDVNIKVDAFPDKKYSGKVVKVANIGEQLRGYDSKVFEVIIQLNEIDSILRPAMTTGIDIITDIYENAVFIPLESLFRDSLSFVYKEDEKGKLFKQEVITGGFNDNDVLIDFGLSEGETIYLNAPESGEKLPFHYIDPEKKKQVLAAQIEDKKKRAALHEQKMKTVGNQEISMEQGNEGGFIIFQ